MYRREPVARNVERLFMSVKSFVADKRWECIQISQGRIYPFEDGSSILVIDDCDGQRVFSAPALMGMEYRELNNFTRRISIKESPHRMELVSGFAECVIDATVTIETRESYNSGGDGSLSSVLLAIRIGKTFLDLADIDDDFLACLANDIAADESKD